MNSNPNVWNHFIGGTWSLPSSGNYLDETDPRTGEASFKIAAGNADDVSRAVASAMAASAEWSATKALMRQQVMLALAREIRAAAPRLAEIDRIETGRPMPAVLGDIETSARYFDFYGGLATAIEGETIDLGSGKLCYTLREPYGVVGCILPWNAPLNQAARAIAPALAAGNAVVAKPSEFTSATTLVLAELACRAGLPAGTLNVVTGSGLDVGAEIVSHPDVSKVAFTGSLRAGRQVGAIAADRVIPVTLELGGKSPDIIFADANFEKAVRGAVAGFTINAGQACLAGTRLLVQRSILDKFIDAVKVEAARLKVGSGDGDQLGPMITRAQFERVQAFFQIAEDEGARVVTGGKPAAGANGGFFVEPTVLADVRPGSRILEEEIFGPVSAIIAFDTEEEAIRIANSSQFGLAAGLWTQDIGRAHRVARQLQAGQVYVNEYSGGGIETPFGGYKKSGLGREKGREALHHYTQLKTVIVDIS